MDHLTLRTAFAAVVSSLTLIACGGGSTSTPADSAAPATGGTTATPVTGVATPNTLSVVTAKNAN